VEEVEPPVYSGNHRKHGLPERLENSATPFRIAFAAEFRQKIANFRAVRPPGIGGEEFQHQRIGMRSLRPETNAFAEGIGNRHGQPLCDNPVVAARFAAAFERMENAENPRESPDHVPLGEIVRLQRFFSARNGELLLGIRSVVEQHRIGRIKPGNQVANQRRVMPVVDKVPAADPERRIGVVAPQPGDDPVIGIEFEPVVFTEIGGVITLGQADGVEKPGRAVLPDMRRSQLKISVEVFILPDIPDHSGRFTVVSARLIQEFRLFHIKI